mgnify:CR=1 FL=1
MTDIKITQTAGVNETPNQNQRGLPEKVLRNKVVVALYLCGFSQRQIASVVKSHKRNVQLFIAKYTPRYKEEILSNIKLK